MLYCKNCKTYFDEPVMIFYSDKEIAFSTNKYVCPNCKEDEFVKADKCDRCGEFYVQKGPLCLKCKQELKKIIADFLKDFTYLEQEVMLDSV
jgi:hypothetical protein